MTCLHGDEGKRAVRSVMDMTVVILYTAEIVKIKGCFILCLSNMLTGSPQCSYIS